MERMKIGSLLSAIGGALITLISAAISYIHSPSGINLIAHTDVPLLWPDLVQDLGDYGLYLGILVMVGVVCYLKGHALAGGLVSVIFSGLSVAVGVLLWLPPLDNLRASLYISPVKGLEVYALLFFSGAVLGVAGGGITIESLKHQSTNYQS